MHKSYRSLLSNGFIYMLLALMLTVAAGRAQAASTTLSNLPLYSATNVPANLMLALSVEFPTGTVGAYTDKNGNQLVYTNSGGTTTTLTCGGTSGGNGVCYFPAMQYLGYFDYTKCYDYSSSGYFVPVSVSTNCTGHWSGNMLNWATMTALDEFRQTLTGGNRSQDTATITVLQRANLNSQSNTGNFPNKLITSANNVAPATVVGDSAFSGATSIFITSSGLGTTFKVSNNSSFSNSGTGNVAKTYNAQVQVCTTALPESNCTAYGSNFKPEGLIQQNYTRIRVGVSAYAFQNGNTQPNGVVRALLRDNGPTTYNGNGARLTNANAEWSATDGTFITNPDSTDTLGTAPGGGVFSKSGAINYLNQFGANGYETFDNIGELYWATLAYYQQTALDASYTTGLTASNSLDTAFPVFTGKAINGTTNPALTVNDPMQYTCQGNAIVTIGDSHTWCDNVVPSSGGPTGTGSCGSQTALAPVNGVDAQAYVTRLGNLPLVEAFGGVAASKTMAQLLNTTTLGTSYEPNSTSGSTYNMAGLAYYAHISDIRLGPNMTGTQSVDTYAVDVMEPGGYDGSSGSATYNPSSFTTSAGGPGPNMYWLAAKYGGFTDVNNNGIPATPLTWHTNSSTAAALNLRPDNYFPGNRPDLIQAGLSQIFSHVSSTKSLSASGPSVSSTRVLSNVTMNTAPYNSPVSGFPIYSTSYAPGSWTGDVNGFVASAVVGGTVTPVTNSANWSAQSQLDVMTQTASTIVTSSFGWNTTRRVITSNGSNAGIPFRYTSLTAAQQTAIGSANLVNFLRGDKTNEGTLFNARGHILGDIVDSQATLVQGALSPQYTNAANPGYGTFATGLANRQPVVYVGANDGMMHAVAADFTVPTPLAPFTGGGSELFAYVPSLLFNGPSSPATPNVDGLAALANLNGVTSKPYAHHFYVDQTPQVADVDFGWTVNTPGTAGTAGTISWHTELVGGLGKGGKGVYALDVTSVPVALDTTTDSNTLETTLATKVLWEFTAPDMGYSYGRPLIVKTRKYGWVVLVTSGYNNPDGLGKLYVLNAKTGTLLETFTTTAGTASNPSGLAQATAYTQDVTDNTIEQVYAGDLLGNVWRFDLSGTTTYPAPVLLATLTDPTGTPQPITTAPRIELDLSSTLLGTRRWVFVGTGKFLDTSDLTSTQQQTMYALRDGNSVSPSTVVTPITRSVLVAANLATGVNLPDSAAGWLYDLTGVAPGTGGATERIVVNPDAIAGIFAINWATVIPTSDPCSLAGAIYSVNFGTGQSDLLDSAGNPMNFITTTTATTNLQYVQLPNGTFTLLYGQTGQTINTAKVTQPGAPNSLLRTNWREITN